MELNAPAVGFFQIVCFHHLNPVLGLENVCLILVVYLEKWTRSYKSKSHIYVLRGCDLK